MRRKISPFFILLGILALTLLAESGGTRRYLTSGSWYPADAAQLRSQLEGYFAAARTTPAPGKIRALISPHAGYQYSGKCAAAAYRLLAGADIERVVLLGPSHHASFYGARTSAFDYFSTPLGSIPVDRTAIRPWSGEPLIKTDDAAMQDEHSLENQLPFLQYALKGKAVRLVPVLIGGLQEADVPRLAKAIRRVVDERTLVVASTDLTHYGAAFGYLPFERDIEKNLAALDRGFLEAVETLDDSAIWQYWQKTGITVCGVLPVAVLAAMFENQGCRATLLDYYKSGDASRDYSLSVSYAALAVTAPEPAFGAGNVHAATASGLSAAEKKTLLAIARDTVEAHVRSGKRPEIDEKKYALSANLKKTLGVFVTLRERGDLRGCIGYIVGVKELYLATGDNAVAAASEDPRFTPVQPGELGKIEIEVSTLTPLQKIADYRRIRLKTDGVVIRKGGYQAVFLPQVAEETGWNLDQFLSQLCLKAGLGAGDYRQPGMEFFVFQAEYFSEKDFRK